ncbi:TPA: phage regulatory protein [Campylobacter jejuni]|uniref:Phage regulatory protein n=2 Tax=Campylobacter jejuni TaxID=197 RepID=A0A431GBG1_CAMJU|nr:Rha family transcriptional regulator [Campylobacter jejuni]ECP9345485.1 phage regulatory protein [Campylobacter jejuni]MCW1368224.1 phage regulatory protein [Campylobacter jejuni]MEA8950237.1 phage regulatory protein [Campylobacter jejuni]RTI82592.1 phage regulatory protein [Campylobacter jejuni]RTJ62512.1 phage regulatory protein [Campylobacter jejuni]
MNDLVYSLNGGLVTDQNKISTISKVDINSIQRLIRNYKQDLECFGKLGFELQKIAKTNKKIYYLNEQQATLLLTYMKNSETVRSAKKILVSAFYQMKEKLKNIEQEQMQKLAFHQSLGYKSQLEQQKTNFNNEIKALKYDLIQTKEELDACKGALEVLKRRKDFNNEENLRLLQEELAKYGLVIFNELDFALWSENLTKNIIGETKRKLDDLTRHNYELLKEKFDKRISYFKDKK